MGIRQEKAPKKTESKKILIRFTKKVRYMDDTGASKISVYGEQKLVSPALAHALRSFSVIIKQKRTKATAGESRKTAVNE
jgi:hypothetical protein